MAQGLDALTREELVELLEITAKDLIALDGTWFQSLEREQGMDTAGARPCCLATLRAQRGPTLEEAARPFG